MYVYISFHQITDYMFNSACDEDTIKNLLAEHRPVSVAIDCDDNFSNYGGGRHESEC